MQILVDADACPVITYCGTDGKGKKEFRWCCCVIPIMYCILDYSEIRIIGGGADAVDFALVNLCKRGYRGDAGLWSGGHGAWERRIRDASVGNPVYAG